MSRIFLCLQFLWILTMQFNRIHIEISNACNLQCSFCPEVLRKKDYMSVSKFKVILDRVSPFTREISLHLMGEPLMHRQLDQILDAAFSAGMPVNLTTNGVLLNEAKEVLLLHSAIRQINFSLQSYPDNFPERNPALYLEKIVNFSKKAEMIRPDLYINFRFWNLEQDSTESRQNEALFEFLERNLEIEIPRTVDVKFRKGRHLRGRMYAHFDSRFEWPSLENAYRGDVGTCKALQNHMGVLSDGTVVPCCLDKEGKIPLGNVLENNFDEIFNSDRTQKMLKGFKCGRLVEDLCKHCSYIKRFDKQTKSALRILD